MELTVQKREIMGKAVKTLRDGGFIPAELYGREFENIHLSVSEKDFNKVFNEAGESVIVQLKIIEPQINADQTQIHADKIGVNQSQNQNKSELVPVLINDIFIDPLTNKISHIDFYRVRMDEKTEVSVPLKFIGEAQAVKEKKGILVKAMQEIEVRALPADLPHNIEISVGDLVEIGESVKVKDIKPIEGVEILDELEAVIAIITEIVEEVVEEKPASVENVKVEGEEKKEEKIEEITEQSKSTNN
ncbi:MAG: 50S ribosomal protein L25 [Spirochaetota bacterium]